MDILTHIDSLPIEIKFYIYGFIHIDNRIAIMTTKYKELIDGSQRSNKFMNLNRSFKYLPLIRFINLRKFLVVYLFH